MFFPGGRAVSLRLAEGERTFNLSEIRISGRVGNTPRRVNFPDGAQFETNDNDGMDRALAGVNSQPLWRWVHAMESRWTSVVAALVIVVVVVALTIVVGIPAAARAVAFALPAETSRLIGQYVLEAADRSAFAPSGLDNATRERVQVLFDEVVRRERVAVGPLEFRKGRHFGANAFALPSGTIIMTDEMVKLAKHDHELTSVFAHEVGHVVERHALRHVLQSSVATLVALAITGDPSSTAAIAGALLVETGYSRGFEREADDYALQYLRREGIGREHFGNLMRRLEQTHAERGLDIPEWLSTHPATEERIRQFELN